MSTINTIFIVITPAEQKFLARRLCVGTETACYVPIVLAWRLQTLQGVIAGYSLRVFAFYVEWLTIAGVSQLSSSIAREIRISQGRQSYWLMFR